METVKDRLRVALALHIVELAENVDQIPSVIANIRQSFIHWRYASRALAQVLDEKHPEPPSPLLEAIKEISTLKTELSQTADKHALEISQKELEIHHLRAQLALASGPSTERLAKKKGKQKEVDGPVISASPSRQQAPAPPVPGKPKTKKSKARDAAVRDLEETLKANHSSEAKDLSHGYAIVDALQSLRGVLSSKLAKGNSTSETKQLFINRLSLLDRGASRLLTAVQGVLNLCVENNTYDGKSGQSSTSLAENSGEIIPVLIDVLNWLMSSVVEHVTSSNKTAAQQLKGNAKDAVLGAGESVQASVATEAGRIIRFCLDCLMSISLRLHHFFQSLNTAPASKIKAKQQTCVLQRQIDTDVRYRLVDLLDALLQLPSSPLQERITAQALLCLLHQLSHCAKFRPNARGFPQRATEVQPYRDTLTLLLPLFEVAILRSRPDMLVDVSCEKGCEILLAQVHDSEAAKTFENLHGTVIKRQLLSSLEGLLLRHSIVDYTRVLNLGPVLPL